MARLGVSGYKGVTYYKRTNQWVARADGEHLGYFATPEQAKAAIDAHNPAYSAGPATDLIRSVSLQSGIKFDVVQAVLIALFEADHAVVPLNITEEQWESIPELFEIKEWREAIEAVQVEV